MTSRADISTTVSRGLAWIGLASSLVWVLDVVATAIVLKFWMPPELLGLAVPAITLFPILDLASELGLGAAIVQRDDHTEERIHTVFWVNLAASVAMALVLVGGVRPILSWIHGNPVVGWLVASYGFKLLWQNVYVVPQSLMRKELQFKETSIARVASNLAEFVAKVGSAAAGLGVWCFVIGPLARNVVLGIAIQIYRPWRPRLIFRYRESAAWVRFGFKQSASQIVYHLYANADYQIVGAFFGPYVLGLYNAAFDLVLKPIYMIGQTVQGVAFPVYARLRLQREELTEQFMSFTRLTMVAILCFTAAIAVAAGEIMIVFYQPKYAAAQMAARVLCLVGVLRALSLAIPPLLDGVGKPGLNLTNSIFSGVVMVAMFGGGALLFGDRLGYMSVAWAWAAGYPVVFALLLYMGLRTLDLSLMAYVRRVAPILAIAGVAVAVGAVVRWTTAALGPGPRLVVTLFSLLAVFLVLLAYWQGISPRYIQQILAGRLPPTVATKPAQAGDGDGASPDV
jgi:teichuronic acid exporter